MIAVFIAVLSGPSAAPLVLAHGLSAGSPVATAEGGQFVTHLVARAIRELTTGDLAMPERMIRFRSMPTLDDRKECRRAIE
jgi:hypothetical protein